MDFYGLTFIMFAGTAIIALGILILMLAAFRTSAAWGIISLLLPPLAFAFGLTHWKLGKTGVAIVVIGSIVFGYGYYDRERQQKEMAQSTQEQRDASVEIFTSPAKESPEVAAPGAATVSKPPVTPSVSMPSPAVQTTEPAAPKAEKTIINIIEANKYVGSEIAVTGKNGVVRTGILIESRPQSIILEYKPKGVDTLIRTEIKEDDIELIELKQ